MLNVAKQQCPAGLLLVCRPTLQAVPNVCKMSELLCVSQLLSVRQRRSSAVPLRDWEDEAGRESSGRDLRRIPSRLFPGWGRCSESRGGGEELRDDQTIKEVRPSVLTEAEEAPVIDGARQTGLLGAHFDILGDNVNKGSQLGLRVGAKYRATCASCHLLVVAEVSLSYASVDVLTPEIFDTGNARRRRVESLRFSTFWTILWTQQLPCHFLLWHRTHIFYMTFGLAERARGLLPMQRCNRLILWGVYKSADWVSN